MKMQLRFAFLAILSMASACRADVIIKVTSLEDPGFNDPATCTLRQAFDNVNAGGVGLKPNGCKKGVAEPAFNRIQLPLGEIKLNSEISHSSNAVLLTGGAISGQHVTRLFRVGGTAHFRAVRMVMRNGFTAGSGGLILGDPGSVIDIEQSDLKGAVAEQNGGAISMDGEFLTLDRVKIQDCLAEDVGGAVYSGTGDLEIVNTRIIGNYAFQKGGAIFNTSDHASIMDSYIEGNYVALGAASSGGGIYTEGDLYIRTSRIEQNYTTEGNGGGLYIADGASAKVVNSSFLGNLTGVDVPGTNYSGGAGIYADGGLSLESVSMQANRATGNGGAINFSAASAGSPVDIVNTMFVQNEASGDGAALWIDNVPTGVQNDALDPLGKAYKFKVLNSSFKQNFGSAAVFVEDDDPPSVPDLLFVNNNINGVGVPGCDGNVARLALKRPNDATPGIPNVEWPESSCGNGVEKSAAAMSYIATGWYFKMAYARSLAFGKLGDPVVCDYIGGVDMFGHPRMCLMGAVEKDAPPVVQPYAPD